MLILSLANVKHSFHYRLDLFTIFYFPPFFSSFSKFLPLSNVIQSFHYRLDDSVTYAGVCWRMLA
jgi:hypothetical protein